MVLKRGVKIGHLPDLGKQKGDAAYFLFPRYCGRPSPQQMGGQQGEGRGAAGPAGCGRRQEMGGGGGWDRMRM